MSLFTLTITETLSVSMTVTSTFLIPISTLTTHVPTTIPATPGQTITVFAPFLPAPAAPTTKYTPTVVPTATITIIELDIALQAPRGDFWTTLTFLQSPAATATPVDPNSGQGVFVAPAPKSGWDSWTHAQQGGLIAGAILCTLFLLACLWCIRQRRKIWVTQDRPHRRDVETYQGRGGNPANYYPGPVLRGGAGGDRRK